MSAYSQKGLIQSLLKIKTKMHSLATRYIHVYPEGGEGLIFDFR